MVFFPMPVVKEIFKEYSSFCSVLRKQKSTAETRKVKVENPSLYKRYSGSMS